MTIEGMIEVLQAAKAGKQIEYRPEGRLCCWLSLPAMTDRFDFVRVDYRVKREPRVIYMNDHIIFGLDRQWAVQDDPANLRVAPTLKPVKFIEVID